MINIYNLLDWLWNATPSERCKHQPSGRATGLLANYLLLHSQAKHQRHRDIHSERHERGFIVHGGSQVEVWRIWETESCVRWVACRLKVEPTFILFGSFAYVMTSVCIAVYVLSRSWFQSWSQSRSGGWCGGSWGGTTALFVTVDAVSQCIGSTSHMHGCQWVCVCLCDASSVR